MTDRCRPRWPTSRARWTPPSMKQTSRSRHGWPPPGKGRCREGNRPRQGGPGGGPGTHPLAVVQGRHVGQDAGAARTDGAQTRRARCEGGRERLRAGGGQRSRRAGLRCLGGRPGRSGDTRCRRCSRLGRCESSSVAAQLSTCPAGRHGTGQVRWAVLSRDGRTGGHQTPAQDSNLARPAANPALPVELDTITAVCAAWPWRSHQRRANPYSAMLVGGGRSSRCVSFSVAAVACSRGAHRRARLACDGLPVMCAVMGDLRVSLSCTSCLRGRLCTGLGDIAGLFACAAVARMSR